MLPSLAMLIKQRAVRDGELNIKSLMSPSLAPSSQRARSRARSRMMQAVPDADVIIRNPTHFAVALRYDIDHDNAPVVIAKGQDYVALKIVEIAENHKVTVIENKPLARGIYASTPLGGQIPAEYYGVVAEILVEVFRMNKKLV